MAKTISFADRVSATLATLRGDKGYSQGKTEALAKSVKGRGRTLDVDIHSMAVAAMDMADKHRNVNTMTLVLNSLPKSARRETLAQWVVAMSGGNIIVTKDKKANEFKCKMQPEAECTPFDMKRILATPFWQAKEKVDAGAFNDAALAMRLERLIKTAGGDKADLSSEGKAALAEIKVLFAKLAPANDDGATDILNKVSAA